jgi:colicin import membrane protein
MAQSGPAERASDRWASIVLSVLLHGVLVAAIAYSWWSYKRDRPAPTLAIEASVVDAKTVPGIGKLPPQPEPAPPPPVEPPPPETQPQVEPEGPPQPTPEELAKREQEQKEQAEREAQAKQQEEDRKRADQEKQQEAALAEEKAAEDKRAEEKRLADEQAKKAQEKADAERKAREAAEKKQADEKRLAEEKKAEDQAKADREADLRRSLDQELRQDAARSSGALASWQSQITARIQRAWLRPASARPGIECVLNVTQVPGGEVTNVRIGACNGDQAVRESIEAAVYRASPLPPPPDPTLFERSLVITFRPD